MTSPIPVIDISSGPTPVVLDQLRHAGENVGLFQVVGHGVPPDLVADWERRVDRLLALPREEKAKLASPTGHPYRGWRQWPDDFGRLELERYMVSRFEDADDARASGLGGEHAEHYAHRNVWPADDPELPEVTFRYRAEAIALAERILGLIAAALDVPADRFASVGPDQTSITVNEYPTWTWPGTLDEGEEKLLLLEHADGNVITLLRQDGRYEGLQIQLPDGEWVPVPIVPDAFVVLFGGTLVKITNDRWRPGRHRVVAGGESKRRSTAIFYAFGPDTVVAPIPELVGTDGPHYEPATAWEGQKEFVDDYLRVFARPEQLEAWRDGRPYVADLVPQE